jgi:peptidoglycan hydrolase-like protein with peptidoglycan-binding domain
MNLQGRDLKLDLTGDDVRLLHTELAQIKIAVPDAERQKALFGPGTRDVILQFQKQVGLPTTGTVDAETAKRINQHVAAQSAPNFTVSGRVYGSKRAGVGGLSLAVLDKNAGPDLLLAQGTTDPRGGYSISYPTAAVVQAGKEMPDLQVQVLVNKVTVGASVVRYNARSVETLDISLNDSFAAMLPTEFESLTADIARHYKGQLGQVQETGSRSDITYLANKTGWDARAVTLAALADQFSQSSQIPSVYFYALFRAGVPANEDALYRVDAGTLTTIWKQANAQGVIPEASLRAVPEVLKQLQAVGSQKLLSNPVIAGMSSFKDMLATVKLTDVQQQQFAQLYTANSADMQAFWKAVGTTLGADLSNRLQVAGKLAFLTVNNAPLMQAISAAIQPAGGIPDPVQLVAAGYHRASQWIKLLTANIPVPTQIPGASSEAKRANYADYLGTQLRLSYPTAAIAEMVKSGDLVVENPDKVNAFLTANQGKFEIGSQSVEQYIAQNKLKEERATVEQIKRLQRAHQITPTDQAMSVLLKQGLDSSYRIVQFDRKTFVDTLGKDLGGPDYALQIYNKATQIHGTVINTVVSYLTAKNGILLGNVPLMAQQQSEAMAEMATSPGNDGQIINPTPAGPTAANASDVIAYATLESLFGSMDFCSCEECRSILSPAAYLVDLLLFIDKAADGKENAQKVLLERRPDIQYLPLTCENTNKPMPYIDVVNETLEYYIANTLQPLSLNHYQGHDTDQTATEDLMTSPQFVMD